MIGSANGAFVAIKENCMRQRLAFLLLGVSSLTFAQSPYAGQESREIKSLSPAEVDGYLAGAGMGFAKAAELNGYPGP